MVVVVDERDGDCVLWCINVDVVVVVVLGFVVFLVRGCINILKLSLLVRVF